MVELLYFEMKTASVLAGSFCARARPRVVSIPPKCQVGSSATLAFTISAPKQ